MGNVVEVGDKNFDAEVVESDLPVLLDFWAPWCGPCRMVSPVIDQLAEEFKGRLKVAKCNTEDSPEVARQFGIRSIPTVVLLRQGEVENAFVGVRPKASYEKSIASYLKKAEKRARKKKRKEKADSTEHGSV